MSHMRMFRYSLRHAFLIAQDQPNDPRIKEILGSDSLIYLKKEIIIWKHLLLFFL